MAYDRGYQPLHDAAAANDVDALRRLLRQGADLDCATRSGFTPLHLAAQEGATAACEALLAAGARVDPVNSYGNTPLWTAVFNSRGNGDVIDVLRTHGADPWHRNKAGATPVTLARMIANYDVAQYFADLDDSLTTLAMHPQDHDET